MQLVKLTFHSDINTMKLLKVRAKKHAFWLTTQEMLSEGFGSDTQEDFFIFDLETLDLLTWQYVFGVCW